MHGVLSIVTLTAERNVQLAGDTFECIQGSQQQLTCCHTACLFPKLAFWSKNLHSVHCVTNWFQKGAIFFQVLAEVTSTKLQHYSHCHITHVQAPSHIHHLTNHPSIQHAPSHNTGQYCLHKFAACTSRHGTCS